MSGTGAGGLGHIDLVAKQFGDRADAYLKSAVHASGPDLDRLAAIVSGRPGTQVLDLGCGGGHVSFRAAAYAARVVAYDLSDDMLKVVARTATERGLDRLEVRQGAAESLDFPDASFDIVLSRYSAHHWRDVPAAMAEARRVLKPGGILAIADVVAPADPLLDTFLQAVEVLRDPSHVRDYSMADWDRMLARAGFSQTGSEIHRVRLEFANWIARMNTPQVRADAVRSLQGAVGAEARAHFAVEADGSLTIDTAVIEAV